MLILVSILLTNVFQEVKGIDKVLSLKPTPVFPPILNTTKVELAPLVEDHILDLFVIKKYLFIISYDMVNATYEYRAAAFNTDNWSKLYEDVFYRSSAYERINVIHDEDEFVSIAKNRLFYVSVVSNNITNTTIDLEASESIVDSHVVDGYIILLTNNKVFVFGHGSFKSTMLDSETAGSIIKARFLRDKLIIVTQLCRYTCSLHVLSYSVVNDTLSFLSKTAVSLARPIDPAKLYIRSDRVKIINSGELTVVWMNGSISTLSLNITDNVIFESFYDDEIFLVTRRSSSDALTYWFFKDNVLLRRIDLDGEDSIYTIINASIDYRSVYDYDTGLMTVYMFTRELLIHELIGDEGFTRMLFLIRTTGYEYIGNVALFPDYRVFLVTSERLGIERYAYLYTIDGNFVFKLGYILTKPGVNVVNNKLTVAFITLEYGVKKILVCYIDKPAVILLRGIKSSITFRDYANRSVTYLYGGGGPDLLVLPSSKGFLRIVSRTCYNGPEEFYEPAEVSFPVDKLSFINTTMYSAQLAYSTSMVINALFMDRNNSTRVFTVTLMNNGVCYIPPGDYIIEAYRAETGLSTRTSLNLNANSYAVIDFDELFNRTIASSPANSKSRLILIAILVFIILVIALFLRSILQYKKTYS